MKQPNKDIVMVICVHVKVDLKEKTVELKYKVPQNVLDMKIVIKMDKMDIVNKIILATAILG